MANSDRAFRALARSQPEVITALLQAVAPGLVQPGVELVPGDLAPTQLDSLPPDLDADFVTRVGQEDLLHVEFQGYRDGKFEERAVWYHVGLAFRHRGKRRVRTVVFWLVRPPSSYPKGSLFSVHDIRVKVTSIVLEDIGASVLLADPRTACLAAGAEAEGRTNEELCAEVTRVLAANNATFAECHMAAVAAVMPGRYGEMVLAMEAANLAPVIIEDLVKEDGRLGSPPAEGNIMAMDEAESDEVTPEDVDHTVTYGDDPEFDAGFEVGFEKGVKRGMEKGLTLGMAIGMRGSLRWVLAARKIALTPEHLKRIGSCMDSEMLHRWLERAVVAMSASEALQ